MSVELLYKSQGIDSARDRVRKMLDKGVDVWLRVDQAQGQTLPNKDEWQQRAEYAQFMAQVAADPLYSRCKGLICGNEPNLPGENGGRPTGISPKWVMTVVSGFGSAADDQNNVFTRVRQANATIQVVIPAVAPWSGVTRGELTPAQYGPLPPGRTRLNAWEEYTATLAWCAFQPDSRWSRADVCFAVHMYSNVLFAASKGVPPQAEPTADLRNGEWDNAQYGSHVYDDFMYHLTLHAGGTPPPHAVTEWNTFVGARPGGEGDPADPAWPANNYPAGLLQNVVAMLRTKVNLLGFAMFIDDHGAAGGCPGWGLTSVTGYLGDCAGGVPEDPASQKGRLQAWDTDFDRLLVQGWG